MRLGIFSDVHANYEALSAVLEAYKRERIDIFYCLGDTVGYGGSPNECLDIIRRLALEEKLSPMAGGDINSKHKLRAPNASDANIKSKRWPRLNVHSRRIWLPERSRFVRLNVTARYLRSIDTIGFWPYLTRTREGR